MTDINLTPIEPGDSADANILMDNLYTLRDAISASEQSVNNKESASNKNAPGGYCGLDNQAHLPEAIKNDVIRATIGAIYPVGSIYITVSTSNTCPIASLISDSTWVKVSSGRVLQGADSSHNPGNTIAAGLPNLYGKFRAGTTGNGFCTFYVSNGGVFTAEDTEESYGNVENTGGSSKTAKRIVFSAKNVSSIYGNSSTVQPPAYCVNIWKRTA
jgi:hypothetical protein